MRASKRLKSRLASTDETHEVANDLHNLHVLDAENDMTDAYQPSSNVEIKQELMDGDHSDIAPPMHRRSHRAMSPSSKAAKQRLLNEQVDFIIRTRDNFEADPNSTTSMTHGPLPWPAVAKLYNEKYGLSLTPAAMEKRARQHRSVWLAEHPAHPRQIVYAKKIKVLPRVRRAKSDVEKKKPRGKTDVVQKKYARVTGWLPPDDVRNQADLSNYTQRSAYVPESERVEWVSIDVVDADDSLLGNVQVRLKDIRKRSAWYRRELEGNMGVDVQLRCSSVAVEWYVQCISAVSRFDLPDDLALQMELYSIAAQLQDPQVCSLVMSCWRKLSEQSTELELDPGDVNNLFHSTESDDPARGFWAAAIHASGVGDQFLWVAGCHTALAAKLEELAWELVLE